ncbi:MAG: SPOR domain-containing protein [Thiomonas sp.]|nr:SPOR domain-containing protein [Thiomonas sp.]
MNDDLQPLKNRLRWLNRSILILGVAILLGVIVWAVRGLGGSESGTKSTVVHPASSASNVATRAASAVTAAQPKPALSTAQQERAAAAAMSALSSASAPAPAAPALASAPAKSTESTESTESSKTSSLAAASAAHSVASAPAAQAVAPETAAPALVPPSTVKPKATERKSAAPTRTAKTSTSAAKHRQAGAVGVCHAAGWYVQVGAFGKQQSIDRLARKLHGAGYTRVCVAAQDVRGLSLFYVGPYRNADAARAARDPLRKLTGTEGLLRKLP